MENLQNEYFGNSLLVYLIAGSTALAGFLAMLLLRHVATRRFRALAEKSKTTLDDLVVDLMGATKGFVLLLLALYFASHALALSPRAVLVFKRIVLIAVLVQALIWGNGLINYWLNRQRRLRLEQDAAGVTTAGILGLLARIALYSVVLLLVLDNLGIDVTALVAGLGVGGVAVALAVQNVLGDLFACLAISLDKPFVIGDFIIIGDYLGVVEHIGLKTTRIRSLSGEQLVFSNNDLLTSRIRNFKRMQERRVVFGFGVVYQTPYEKIQKIPGMVKDIVEAREGTRFDRAHFKSYGESSLDFEVVYYINTPDYNTYMDTQQAINLEIFRQFQEAGIDFAYPTRTLYLEKS
jgi:small-conductance mechanosensitive channel